MTDYERNFPKRTVHLDFHTGPDVPDIGKNFDPDEFARVFKEAHVDSVTLFAMCHHGLLYYDTAHPARHPNLSKDTHLLEGQIEALRRVGIKTPIYLSVNCNEYAANNHPEWIAMDGLTQVKWAPSAFTAGWQIMDMSSPYQEFLTEIYDEVLRKFSPVDGIFLDMCWDQPSTTKWFIDGMKKRGYNPKDDAERSKYAREVVHSYMKRYRDMLDIAQSKEAGIWFNSRPKTNLDYEKKFLRHIEIESLPTGGWGYMYFPYVSRFVRPLGLPTLSHTGRFFKSWGDNTSLKPEMALKYENCQMLSQGITCGIGDLLHPSGVPSKAVYDLIGKVYGYVESIEPYIKDAKPAKQIALIVNPALGDNPGPSGIGAVRALTQLHQQFDIVPPETELKDYELIIIPESTEIDAPLKAKLSAYVKSGGGLIVCGRAALGSDGSPAMDELGIDTFGESPYSHTFLHVNEDVRQGLPDYAHVMYERGFMMKPKNDAASLVKVGIPYFERSYDCFSGHEYTPEKEVSEYSAVVQKGKVITFSVNILEAYGLHSAPIYRDLFNNCINRLITPLVKAKGTNLEVIFTESQAGAALHFISFCPERRAEGLDIVEDAVPVVNMPVSIRLPKRPSKVYMVPGEKELDYQYEDGCLTTEITFLDGHCVVIAN